MSESLIIPFFTLGAVILLISLIRGNFKILGTEIANTVSNKYIRFLCFLVGSFFIALSVFPSLIRYDKKTEKEKIKKEVPRKETHPQIELEESRERAINQENEEIEHPEYPKPPKELIWKATDPKLEHNIGRNINNIWVVYSTDRDMRNNINCALYGPYPSQDLGIFKSKSDSYQAKFTLAINEKVDDNVEVVKLDVLDIVKNAEVESLIIKGGKFDLPNKMKTFYINFNVPSSESKHSFQYRIWPMPVAGLQIKEIGVKPN